MILTRLSLTNAGYALQNISLPQPQVPCPSMPNALQAHLVPPSRRVGATQRGDGQPRQGILE
jgi:hypothetical protein